MKEFFRNQWASLALVVCAAALCAVEVFVPYFGFALQHLIAGAALVLLIFCFGFGVNPAKTSSKVVYYIVLLLVMAAHLAMGMYLTGFSDMLQIATPGVTLLLFSVIPATIAIGSMHDRYIHNKYCK